MITELNIDKETVLNLQMDIEGNPATGDVPELKFCIHLDAFSVVFKGEKTTDNNYEIKFPKMKGIICVGDYPATVDVFIGDKRFEAMTDTVTVKQDVKPVVKPATKKDKEPTISVKAAVVAPQSPAKPAAVEEAAEIEEMSPLQAYIEKTGKTVTM